MEERMPDGILEKSMKKLDEEIADIVSKSIKGSHDQCMEAVSGIEKGMLKNETEIESCSKDVSKANNRVSKIDDAISNLKEASNLQGESNRNCMDTIRAANEKIGTNAAALTSAISSLARTENKLTMLSRNNAEFESTMKDLQNKQSGLKRWIVGLAFLVAIETVSLCYLLFDK